MTVAPAVAQLVVLTALAVAGRRLFLRSMAAPTAAGSMVMAVGIFGLAALQQTPAGWPAIGRPLALALLVLWGIVAASYFVSWLDGTFAGHVDPPVGRFAIGSWVAATAVLCRLVLVELPEWRPLAVALGFVAFGTWLWFLVLAARALRDVAAHSSRSLVPSVVLLSTVSTQSLALAGFDLNPERSSLAWAAASLIVLGVLFYLAGVALVVRSHVRAPGWTLADDWDNTNCILHGAMSITGLAVVIWQAAPPAVELGLWLYVACVFVAVEAIELARLGKRIAAYGWRRGAFSYCVTQWSRNFTFGMFFAFTLAVSRRPEITAGFPWVEAIQAPILAWGPWILLALLLVEIGLFLDHRLDRRAVVGAAAGLARRLDRRPDRRHRG